MISSTTPRPDFVPVESIVAFVFIGFIALVGLIARCLAQNHSTIRSSQNLDLMIYQPAPKQMPISRARRSSTEAPSDSNGDIRDRASPMADPTTPARVQRGPKNI